MLDARIDRETHGETSNRRSWLRIAVASLVAAPVALYAVAILLLLLAFGWAESNLDASNLIPLLVGGLLGGLAVGLYARLRGYELSIPAVFGGLVGLGFYYLIFRDAGTLDQTYIWTIYMPAQTLTYFLASWLPGRHSERDR